MYYLFMLHGFFYFSKFFLTYSTLISLKYIEKSIQRLYNIEYFIYRLKKLTILFGQFRNNFKFLLKPMYKEKIDKE